MKKLIITEKANAARRIASILSEADESNSESSSKVTSASNGGVTVLSFHSKGDECSVISLRGHIMELDYQGDYNDWGKVDPVDLVFAKQTKMVRVKSILSAISDIASRSDEVIIATDFDREGELIGMETVVAAGIGLSKVKRAKFSALTYGEVREAFSNLGDPDVRLADAAEARQVIDLAWGAVLTRLISLSSGRVGKNFLSVGRVQSPTLKLLVDRHEEIEGFVPVPYWNISARFGEEDFKGDHASNPFWDKVGAEGVMGRIGSEKVGTVSSFEVFDKEEYRPAPFDTTAMQVEANKIGISPTTTMKLAEDLYTGGYISYPRTENTEYPRTLSIKSVLEKLKGSSFKSEVESILAQERIIPSKGKRRTTDHPPIYPTAVADPVRMKGDKWKLYELIVRRFLATLGPNAVAEVTKATIDIAGEPFTVEGYVQRHYGWKAFYRKYLKITEVKVPTLEIGSKVQVGSVASEETETMPPYRYNQGSLIQEMDRLQLGTKSTRHDIIGKLFSREYVQGNYLIPTASGIALTKSLMEHGGGITEPDMTARLEADMLKISEGETSLESVVEESQNMLHSVATKISAESEDIGNEMRDALKQQQFVGVCPKCGNNMNVKRSKNGLFIGCDGYPDCKCTYPLPNGALVQMTEVTCPVCNLPQLKVIRRGVPPSVQCIDPKCASNVEVNELGDCPTCGTGMVRVVYSKAGKRFAGCSGWPGCKQTYPLRPRGTITRTSEHCEICKSPLVMFNGTKECLNMGCESRPRKSTGGTVGKVVKRTVGTKAKKPKKV